MKNYTLLATLTILTLSLAHTARAAEPTTPSDADAKEIVAGQHAQTGKTDSSIIHGTEAVRNQHPDAQWFPEAGLGLFVHFGLSAVNGDIDLSWGMMNQNERWGQNLITPVEYWKQVEKFNPVDWNPDKWLAAAKAMGARYAVLTTRHCEGFALWPSKYGDFNTGIHFGGRDLVKEFVEACRKHDLKVGLYYCPMDWKFNRKYTSFRVAWDKAKDKSLPDLDENWQPAVIPEMPEDHKEAFRAYVRGQMQELLTQYGQIDVFWLDGYSDAVTLAELREWQPSMLINNRFYNPAIPGDFYTPEIVFPEVRPPGWWELCKMWNNWWGYSKQEVYTPAQDVWDLYQRCRAWDGNLLINVGPNASGDLPPIAYERFLEFAKIREAAEATAAAQASPK